MNELTIVHANDISPEHKIAIDNQIAQILRKYKDDRGEINRLTFDCVTALTAGQARNAELANQGFFKRFWGGITGKNQRLQAEINSNFTDMLYASQKLLKKFAKKKFNEL